MIPLWLFQQDAEVVVSGINGKGEPFTKTIANYKCRIDPHIQLIKKSDGSTANSTGKGLFPVGSVLSVGNIINCDGTSYEVGSAIAVPTLFGTSHVEALLI